MSVTIHHAIIVTGYIENTFVEAYTYAKRLFGALVTRMITSNNGTQSFAILPDGSNDGWGTSTMHDDLREKMVSKLRELQLWFVEVEYGENGTKILKSDPEQVNEKAQKETDKETQH